MSRYILFFKESLSWTFVSRPSEAQRRYNLSRRDDPRENINRIYVDANQ